jgi:hypothetical protein
MFHHPLLLLLFLLLLFYPTTTALITSNNKQLLIKTTLQQSCENFWSAWRSGDRNIYSNAYYSIPNNNNNPIWIGRQTFRAGELLIGLSQLLGPALTDEWNEFERNTQGEIVETLAIQGFEIISTNYDMTSPTNSPVIAVVRYSAQTKGGIRWKYTDQGFIMHVLQRSMSSSSSSSNSEQWKTRYVFDTWSLSYNYLKPTKQSKATFTFDWVHPVQVSISKARTFYDVILGNPDFFSSTFASYSLRGGNFHLISTNANPPIFLPNTMAQVKPNLPNGYAIIHQPNYVDSIKTLRQQHDGAILFDGNATTGIGGGDQFVAVQDSAGNVLVVKDFNFNNNIKNCISKTSAVPVVQGFGGGNNNIPLRIAKAWIMQNSTEIINLHQLKTGSWFDSTRVLVRGPIQVGKELSRILTLDWASYDKILFCIAEPGVTGGNNGWVDASWVAASIPITVELTSTISLVIYDRILQSNGLANHPFKERAHIAHLIDLTTNKILQTCMGNAAARKTGIVKSFDYSAYPVQDMNRGEHFYRSDMGFTSSYTDTDWLGFWSTDSVFGIYKSKTKRDGIPVKGKTNGYLSLEVRNVSLAYEMVVTNNNKFQTTFPLILAINSKKGIDVQPGYTQLVCTDIDGNVVVFTSYP